MYDDARQAVANMLPGDSPPRGCQTQIQAGTEWHQSMTLRHWHYLHARVDGIHVVMTNPKFVILVMTASTALPVTFCGETGASAWDICSCDRGMSVILRQVHLQLTVLRITSIGTWPDVWSDCSDRHFLADYQLLKCRHVLQTIAALATFCSENHCQCYVLLMHYKRQCTLYS